MGGQLGELLLQYQTGSTIRSQHHPMTLFLQELDDRYHTHGMSHSPIQNRYQYRLGHVDRFSLKNQVFLKGFSVNSVIDVKTTTMRTKILYIIGMMLLMATTSCSVFKGGGCDCPKFTHQSIDASDMAQVETTTLQ